VAELVTNHEVSQATRSTSPLRRSYFPLPRDPRVVAGPPWYPRCSRPRSSGARRRRLCRPSPQEPELATATSENGALVP
jgi:hypothetical protein